MICVSLAELTLAECLETLKGLPFAEIRLDRMHLSSTEVAAVFSGHKRLIATCRPGEAPKEERKGLLLAAIDSGAAYVDVEVDAEASFRDEIKARARKAGCTVIVSFHDHSKTPEREELAARVATCFEAGADIAKIACRAHTDRDNARLLGLLDHGGKIVVVAMGAKGRIVRVAAPLLGSPFTFASLSEGRETAEGQMDKRTLSRLVEFLRRGTG